ncbi:MAG: GerMN domain-containing protein [Candidatus Vogelbacteria bacterium]
MQQTQTQSQPKVPEKKSNLWLIIIIIVVLLALLWPVLRRGKTPAEPTLGEGETATTSEETILNLGETATEGEKGSPSEEGKPLVLPTPVPVAPTSLALKVFFGNQKGKPQTWQCNMVTPVIRTVANTSAVARAALTELLKGPRPADSSSGSFTALNPGVTIKELTINNGVARVNFGQPLITATGTSTCLKDGARAQITETLKQFPTVRSVIISVNGVLF